MTITNIIPDYINEVFVGFDATIRLARDGEVSTMVMEQVAPDMYAKIRAELDAEWVVNDDNDWSLGWKFTREIFS